MKNRERFINVTRVAFLTVKHISGSLNTLARGLRANAHTSSDCCTAHMCVCGTFGSDSSFGSVEISEHLCDVMYPNQNCEREPRISNILTL